MEFVADECYNGDVNNETDRDLLCGGVLACIIAMGIYQSLL